MGFSRIETGIQGLCIIEPQVFPDERGLFFESYNEKAFTELGINTRFVQDNQSESVKGVLRGLHRQIAFPQAKLVRVVYGEVYDVAVDIRKGSPTYGKYYGVILSRNNNRQFYIPEGFLHGFLVLSERATFAYKVNDFYHPNDEGGIVWNDPDIGIEWPLKEYNLSERNIILSEKDKNAPRLKDLQ